MNDLTIEKLIMSHLATFALFDIKRTARANINFTPPANGIWIRITIKPSYSQITSVTSDPCITDTGTVFIQIFDKTNTGTGAIKKYASQLARHFNCKQFFDNGQLDTGVATVIDAGDDGEGFYQFNLNIPYNFYSH